MTPIDDRTLEMANKAAIFNLYLYLTDKSLPVDDTPFRTVVAGLETALADRTTPDPSYRHLYRLRILRNAVERDPALADSRIRDLTRSESGMTACTFVSPSDEVFVVFRGTGSGEWIDNGEGLSGIPEENTYISYNEKGAVQSRKTVQKDYATDQQVEALNWFHRISAQNGWNENTKVIVSGHSKGGNKAQFVALHSPLAAICFSFDGQGFSPEALLAFGQQYGAEYDVRRRKLHSFSADNDYVNVLGERLMPETQVYYFDSSMGFHYLEAMLDVHGRFRPQGEQGKLSRYIEAVSGELMRIAPFFRQYATLGIMNIFQQYLGEGTSVNADEVSIEETIAGIGVAIGPLLRPLG